MFTNSDPRWINRTNHTDEVTAEITSEGMTAESVFLERAAGDTLLIYTAATDLIAANRAFQTSMIPINVKFRALMSETLDLSAATAFEVLFAVP